VVVPQNLAGAVNYACLECVTYALATQLVVSLPGPLGEAGMAELVVIWEELRRFGEQIEDVPLAELRDRLTEFEARILGVVQEHAGGAGEPSVEAGDPDPDTSEDGTSGSGTATATDGGDDAAEGDGTTGSTGSATPTGSSSSGTGSAPSGGPAEDSTAGSETASATPTPTPTG
jgi:putative peptide zinc metalloprotease protein